MGLASRLRSRFSGARLRARYDSHLSEHGPQLVWSGPEATGTLGDTRRVYEDLFSSAKRSLWVVSYAYRDSPDVFGRLARHLDATPKLQVTLVLNIERYPRKEKKHRIGTVAARFARDFWQHWPGKRRPRVYYDPRSVRRDLKGKVHAKVVVADETRALITSANLTARAWDDNIELGVLVRDPSLASGVLNHFQELIRLGHLRALPGSERD